MSRNSEAEYFVVNKLSQLTVMLCGLDKRSVLIVIHHQLIVSARGDQFAVFQIDYGIASGESLK